MCWISLTGGHISVPGAVYRRLGIEVPALFGEDGIVVVAPPGR
jgi:hypothetical protein